MRKDGHEFSDTEFFNFIKLTSIYLSPSPRLYYSTNDRPIKNRQVGIRNSDFIWKANYS